MNVTEHKNIENVIRYFLLFLPPRGRRSILDIGSGVNCPYKGVLKGRLGIGGEYRALDIRGAPPKVDHVMDLTKGSHFEDNHWEWGWCSEVIEHIDPDKKKIFVNEAIRICENIVFTFPTPKLKEVFYDDPGHTEVKINFEEEYSHSYQITDKTTKTGRAIIIMNKLFDGNVVVRPAYNDGSDLNIHWR
ncbi:MAG: hypothetical protein HN982_08065 [Candidatus Marinimicrobia bacterium]|jgi:hypothetical protein|nr:hypothetical protein [Candidatus Woesearchaeota archaeon]MBT6937524.1 hypothetical protein [Candidatus Neomarinimicrobiota bacterium]